MKLLQLCHKMPFPLNDGGAQSIYYTALGLLSQGVELKILAINTPKSWVELETVPPDFQDNTNFEYCKVDTRIKPIKAFMNLYSNQSYFVERFYSDEFNNHLIKILSFEKFDVVQLEHSYLGLYIKTIRNYSKAKIILRPQNVENKVWERYLEKKLSFLKKIYLRITNKRLLKFEKMVANKVDGIIAISYSDKTIFQSYACQTPIAEVPMGFDFKRADNKSQKSQINNFPDFYHLGSMDWMPNVQGLKWFINDVLPFVIEKYPDFRFHIAGKKMPNWFLGRQNRNLTIDGEIDNAFHYQQNHDVMIVPLLSGGGIRVKIIEGMALGKAIISTSIGAEGIPYTNGENILIANTKEEFAKRIGECLVSKDYCRKIGNKARILAREQFDLNKTARRMIAFYSILK